MKKHLTFLLFFLFVLLTLAGSRASASTSIYLMTPEEIDLLKDQPLSLLSKFLQDSSAMARYVASAVIEDPSVVGAILSTASATTPEQAAALGAGLARGARALSVKKPKVARAIKDQVMQSENLQLKITFLALGPSYEAELAPKLPDIIPPPPIADCQILGSEIPQGASKIGPFKIPKPNGATTDINGNARLNAESRQVMDYVVFNAIINSDARHNGAVSTSPTQ